MAWIKAKVQNGRIEPESPLDLPEGTELEVRPTSAALGGDADADDEDDDWDNSPEGIADWLKWYDSLEPLIFTDEERAAWQAARAEQKAWELAHFEEYSEKLRKLWD